jgi:hypothetical protein
VPGGPGGRAVLARDPTRVEFAIGGIANKNAPDWPRRFRINPTNKV